MKILSWNVNGLLVRLDAVNRMTETINPDILCFQKVRTKRSFLVEIPRYMRWLDPIESDGLFGGISTYTRHGLVDFEKQGISIPNWLLETGCIAALNLYDFFLINAYFPYANAGNEKFVKIRQRWDYEFHDFIERLSTRKPIVLCGDLNIVSDDIDAWDGVSVKNAGCFFPWEHRNFELMMRQINLVDSYRRLHPDKKEFTYFFHNRSEYRLENKGHRIDYFLVSDVLMPKVVKSEILTEIGNIDISPILLEIN